MSSEWLLPAIGFVLLEGALGVTTKLALRAVAWQQLLLWTALAYAAVAPFMLAAVGGGVPLGAGAGWAALSGAFASVGLLVFFIALGRGEASRVVPITAAYPLVTAVLAALVLSERIDTLRGLGTLLIVTGVVWLGSE